MNKRENSILLETGTNELEVLEFVIDGSYYGINIAKVRELIRYQAIMRIPYAQRGIEGIIRSRDEIFTVVDLAEIFNRPASENPEHDIFIITDFNQMSLAFHVHMVLGISRISWKMIEKPSSAIYGNNDGLITGIAKLDNRIITMIDFEKILYDINPYSSEDINSGQISLNEEHRLKPILIVEDSRMLNKLIIEALNRAGYRNIIKASDGQEAWDYLQTVKDNKGSVACVITDIEMPHMDGHHLTKRIKEDNVLSGIPVIIFSSLITDTMKLKGEKVGADAQLSKPEIGQLVQTLDQIICNGQTL